MGDAIRAVIETIIALLYFIVPIIFIWLIVKFVRLCSDVAEIKAMMRTERGH